MSHGADNANGSAPVHENRVAVIGAGNVGATTAYALLQTGLVREILLLDRDENKAEGEALDLQHAAPLGPPVEVRATSDYAEAARSAIVVITAGAANKPGGDGPTSRLDLLDQNVGVVRECVGRLRENGFDGILLMTTNPVDVLAQVAQEEFDLPPARVIGSGTVLDTARLCHLLAGRLNVAPQAINAFIVGEHGDSEVAAWSCARVAGVPLVDFAGPNALGALPDLLQEVRAAAPAVVERKGSTSFAIASCVARICEAVLRDERAVLCVSARLSGKYGLDDVYLGTPCVVGASGIERVIALPLNDEERSALHASARVLREARAKVAAA